MSDTASGALVLTGGAGQNVTAKPRLWDRIKFIGAQTEKEASFLKRLTIISLVGTVLGTLFQTASSYQQSVSTLAQGDMTKATAALTQTSTALSAPLSLQQRLISDYEAAINASTGKAASANLSAIASDIYKQYLDANTKLRENYNLVARNAQIYLDWASDSDRDPAKLSLPDADKISVSKLGRYGFDCNKDLPAFGVDKDTGKDLSKLGLPHGGQPEMTVDWNSVKHNVLTIYYCFDTVSQNMAAVREWASGGQVDKTDTDSFTKSRDTTDGNLNNQVLRLDALLGVSMNAIEKIRVKYRPSGFWCTLPIAGTLIDWTREIFGYSNMCAPVRTGAMSSNSLA